VPIAEIADAWACKQSVNITRALVKGPGRRADEYDCLIGAHLDSKIQRPTGRLTDDWKLWSPLHAKTPAVDGAVRTNREGQLAA
jgi:hypothetical protein